MPRNNSAVAREQWSRYVYARDTGHRDYVAKANKCEDFFAGMQWDPEVVRDLANQKRPAITLNKVLITLSSIFGEQIDLRSETGFKPRYGAPPQNADILTKVYKFVSDENQLTWKRSDVFADGCITSRGYYDVRLKFDTSTAGEIAISRLNPRAVLPDPDAYEYDPETWNDVICTSWVTSDDIELMFDNKEAADALRIRGESIWGSDGYDSLDLHRDRFGGNRTFMVNMNAEVAATMRGIRLIDRQHRVLTKRKYFVDPKSGDKMHIPDAWGREDIAFAVERGGLIVSSELCKRVKWTVTAEDFVLHDEWSPFDDFTVVPYFPHFRFGRTIGLVETLIDPQELLNKSVSQELHIINTTANSGWKVRSGSLINMTVEDLEESGAKTGLIIETQGKPDEDVVKITPNTVPTGLDRLSFKAEQYIKTISGRGDNQLGLTRPDQSGKLTEESNKASDVNLRTALDNLERTDHMLAKNILSKVQKFYTDRRIMHITRSELTGEYEEIGVNVPDLASGEILNDLSLGTYDIVITSQNARRTLEESEFVQAIELQKLGVPIPPRFLVENSNLRKKGEIIKAMEAAEASPEGQLKREAGLNGLKLQVADQKADISDKEAKAVLNRTKAAKTAAETEVIAKGEPGEEEKAQNEMVLKQQEHDQKMQHMREKHELEIQIQREKSAREAEQARLDAHANRQNERVKAVASAKAMASGKGPAQGQQSQQPQGAK